MPDSADRYEAYERAVSYKADPAVLSLAYADATLSLAEEINQASSRIADVTVGDGAKRLGLRLIHELKIESNRAEITLFETAKAYCVSDERMVVQPTDIESVALMSLRLRQSDSLTEFHGNQDEEDTLLLSLIEAHGSKNGPGSE